MKALVKNNNNDFSKRKASQVRSILRKNELDCKVWACGDGREFELVLKPTIQNLMKIKLLGFIRTTITSETIYVKAF